MDISTIDEYVADIVLSKNNIRMSIDCHLNRSNRDKLFEYYESLCKSLHRIQNIRESLHYKRNIFQAELRRCNNKSKFAICFLTHFNTLILKSQILDFLITDYFISEKHPQAGADSQKICGEESFKSVMKYNALISAFCRLCASATDIVAKSQDFWVYIYLYLIILSSKFIISIFKAMTFLSYTTVYVFRLVTDCFGKCLAEDLKLNYYFCDI